MIHAALVRFTLQIHTIDKRCLSACTVQYARIAYCTSQRQLQAKVCYLLPSRSAAT